MSNEIGTTLLNGITNSTFDIGNMSKTLAEAEVAGPRAILDRNQEKATTELDALKYLKTNMEAFNTYVTDLSSPDIFSQKQVTSSDDSVISVTAESSAALASYQIESRQLAQAQTMVANKGFASASDTLQWVDDGSGSDSLDITIGGQTHSISVNDSNNTLEGLQKTINNGDYGVTASIVNNGGSYQMMFSSKETGSAAEFSISGLPDVDTDGLTTTAQAQDAVISLNGLTVTSSNNTFDDLVEGMSFQLHSAAPGSQQSISVGQDSATVKEAVTSFVDVYNQLDTILDELGSYDSVELTKAELESEEYMYYGDLAGDGLLRSVKSQVRESMSGALDALNGSNYQSLADIGVNFNREGQLELDSAKLDSVISNNMQALSDMFAKGGNSDDAMVNVLGGSDETQAGDYALNVTQLADRASLTGGNVTLSTDERLSGDRIIDATGALTIDSGAKFDLNIGGTTNTVNLDVVSGTYENKDAVATAIQDQIDVVFGTGVAAVGYDATQSRFEITANTNKGNVDITSTTGLSNQGFGSTTYAGQQLVDLSAADATFNVKVDDSTASAVTIQSGRYTLDELSQTMADNINNNADIQGAGGVISVTHDGASLSVTSTRYGTGSIVELTGISNFGNAGFTADASDMGQNIGGSITTASGTLSLGAYADSQDGRKISISDYAVINGNAAEVRGLELEVLGGATGARGTITYSQGFASQLEQTISNLFESDTGLVSNRIEGLSDRLSSYEEKSKDIDARYEQMLIKYQLQFSSLQSLLSSTEQTKNYLSATFNNNSSN